MRFTRPGARTKRVGSWPRKTWRYPATSDAGTPGEISVSTMLSLRRRGGDTHAEPRHAHLKGAAKALAPGEADADGDIVCPVMLVFVNRLCAIGGLAVA